MLHIWQVLHDHQCSLRFLITHFARLIILVGLVIIHLTKVATKCSHCYCGDIHQIQNRFCSNNQSKLISGPYCTKSETVRNSQKNFPNGFICVHVPISATRNVSIFFFISVSSIQFQFQYKPRPTYKLSVCIYLPPALVALKTDGMVDGPIPKKKKK